MVQLQKQLPIFLILSYILLIFYATAALVLLLIMRRLLVLLSSFILSANRVFLGAFNEFFYILSGLTGYRLRVALVEDIIHLRHLPHRILLYQVSILHWRLVCRVRRRCQGGARSQPTPPLYPQHLLQICTFLILLNKIVVLIVHINNKVFISRQHLQLVVKLFSRYYAHSPLLLGPILVFSLVLSRPNLLQKWILCAFSFIRRVLALTSIRCVIASPGPLSSRIATCMPRLCNLGLEFLGVNNNL